MKIEIVNQQKIKRINLKKIHAQLKKAESLFNISSNLSRFKTHLKLSILLCDNHFIRRLNKRYFKDSCSTDVISFPLADDLEPGYLGEVIVSVEKALGFSKKNKCDWKKELLLYIIHGILHLLGYSDKTSKEKNLIGQKQQEIVDKILER